MKSYIAETIDSAEQLCEPLTDTDCCSEQSGPDYERVDCFLPKGHMGMHYDDYRGIYWMPREGGRVVE